MGALRRLRPPESGTAPAGTGVNCESARPMSLRNGQTAAVATIRAPGITIVSRAQTRPAPTISAAAARPRTTREFRIRSRRPRAGDWADAPAAPAFSPRGGGTFARGGRTLADRVAEGRARRDDREGDATDRARHALGLASMGVLRTPDDALVGEQGLDRGMEVGRAAGDAGASDAVAGFARGRAGDGVRASNAGMARQQRRGRQYGRRLMRGRERDTGGGLAEERRRGDGLHGDRLGRWQRLRGSAGLRAEPRRRRAARARA